MIDRSEPILIWGAGAIGGAIGAALVRAEYDVTFVDIVEDHVAAIADPARGLRISGPIEEYRIVAPSALPGALTGRFRHIFLAVKSQFTEAACRALLPHLADDGSVVSLQNGLCEATIAGVVGPERTVGAFVNFSVDYMEPGHIHYGGRGAVVVGETGGGLSDCAVALRDLLAIFEPNAIASDNINGYLWGKLGFVAILFVQSTCESGMADTFERPELLSVWTALGREVMAVAVAEGMRPLGFNGFDPDAFMPGGSAAAIAASVDAMVAFNRPNAKTHSGMWRDLWVRRRQTEIDAQLVPVVALARSHGIATPFLDSLIDQVHQCEAGVRAMTDDNPLELLAL